MGQTAAIGSGGGYRVAPEMIEFWHHMARPSGGLSFIYWP